MTEPYAFWYNYLNTLTPSEIHTESDMFRQTFLSCLSDEIEKSSDPELYHMALIVEALESNSDQKKQQCMAYFMSLNLFRSNIDFEVAYKTYTYLVIVLKQYKIITHKALDKYLHKIYEYDAYTSSHMIFTFLCKTIMPMITQSSEKDIDKNYSSLITRTAFLLIFTDMKSNWTADTTRFKYLTHFYSTLCLWLQDLIFCVNHSSSSYLVADIVSQELLVELFPDKTFTSTRVDIYDDYLPVISNETITSEKRLELKQRYHNTGQTELSLLLQQSAHEDHLRHMLIDDLKNRHNSFQSSRNKTDDGLRELGALAQLLRIFPVYVPVAVNFLYSIHKVDSTYFWSCYSLYVR